MKGRGRKSHPPGQCAEMSPYQRHQWMQKQNRAAHDVSTLQQEAKSRGESG